MASPAMWAARESRCRMKGLTTGLGTCSRQVIRCLRFSESEAAKGRDYRAYQAGRCPLFFASGGARNVTSGMRSLVVQKEEARDRRMRRGRGAYCLIRAALLSNFQSDAVDHGVRSGL